MASLAIESRQPRSRFEAELRQLLTVLQDKGLIQRWRVEGDFRQLVQILTIRYPTNQQRTWPIYLDHVEEEEFTRYFCEAVRRDVYRDMEEHMVYRDARRLDRPITAWNTTDYSVTPGPPPTPKPKPQPLNPSNAYRLNSIEFMEPTK